MATRRAWIGALILIALGILISSVKNGRMDLRNLAQQDTWTQQFFTKKVDPCLHLKSSKDLSLEIFEHAKSHNTVKCVGTTHFVA